MLAGVKKQRVSLENVHAPSSFMVTSANGWFPQTRDAIVTFAVVQL
jgi:hypothetical protein